MLSLNKISQSPSQTFVYLLAWFILGVALASALDMKRAVLFQLYLGLIILVAALILSWSKKNFRLIILGGIFLLFGLMRFVFSEPPADSHHLRFYHGRLVEIEGLVAEEPEEKNGKQTLIVESEQLKIVNLLTSLREFCHPERSEGSLNLAKNLKGFFGLRPQNDSCWTVPNEANSNNNEIASPPRADRNDTRVQVKGRAILYLPSYPQYNYGDQLKIICELAEPQKNQDFDYPAFLARQGIWSICQNPKIEKTGEGKGSWLMTGILKVKSALIGQVNWILPEPQASFLGGLLYGARSTVPADLQQAFIRAGIIHIIAISGYNITILAAALLALLKGCWIPRQKAFWFTVAGIIFFVLLTGASASVVRAGLMGLIVLLARQLGRLSQVGRILLVTAFLMLLINPRVLFFDAGFQLSFVSTLGLVYLSPVLEKSLAKMPAIFGLKESLLTTLSAIVATLPLTIYQFGRFSLIAPLANLLVLPIIPLTMALGFGAVVLSFIFPPLGQIIGWLVWLPLTYIIRITEFFSSLPWAALSLPKLPWWGMGLIYMNLAIIVYKLKFQKSKSSTTENF